MEFEWDEVKNASNKIKHGISFTDALRIFFGDTHIRIDDRRDYGEVRYQAYGELNGRVVVVVFTRRGEGRIRIISARKAHDHEQRTYRSLFPGQPPKG